MGVIIRDQTRNGLKPRLDLLDCEQELVSILRQPLQKDPYSLSTMEELRRLERGVGRLHVHPHTEESSLLQHGLESKYKLGYETEFYLTAKVLQQLINIAQEALKLHASHSDGHNHVEFAERMMLNYNQFIQQNFAGSPHATTMLNLTGKDRKTWPQNRFDHWCLELEDDMKPKRPPPYGIEVVSPVLLLDTWRSVLDSLWQFFQGFYDIKAQFPGHDRGSTHLHVSQEPPFELEDIQLFATGCIYWEPAWLAALPECRRGGAHIQSLFLENENFAPAGKTREEAIEMIWAERSIKSLVRLLQGMSKDFAWNFQNLNMRKKPKEAQPGKEQPLHTIECRTTRSEIDMNISINSAFVIAILESKSKNYRDWEPCTVPNLEKLMLSVKAGFHAADIRRFFDKGVRERTTIGPVFSTPELWTQEQQDRAMEVTKLDFGR
ncbi:MAG: hypothetical protein Q9162_005318 [Coniocarpon cinnabarinum]